MEINEKGRSIRLMTNLAKVYNNLFGADLTLDIIDSYEDNKIYQLLDDVRQKGNYTLTDLELLLLHEPIQNINL